MPSTFADIFPVKQTSSHEYTVHLDKCWCIGIVPNGGYITSAFMMVARTHMEKNFPSKPHQDVINLHLQFLRPTSAGPATFKVKDIKIGSRISNLHLTLSQHKDQTNPDSPIHDEVEGYISISSITSEAGPTNDTNYRLSPLPLPVSLDALAHNQDKNYILRRNALIEYGFRPGANNVKMHLIKPSARGPDASPASVDEWALFSPTQSPDGKGRWTNDSLGALVDIFPQLHENFIDTVRQDAILSHPSDISDEALLALSQERQKTGTSNSFWYPTMLLNLDVKKKLPDEGVEWLFLRLQAKKMQNGRFDISVEVWDDPINGELVALASQSALVVDASRNLKTGKRKPKPSKM